MDLLAAALVFISPEGKQASFIQTGKRQISLAKKSILCCCSLICFCSGLRSIQKLLCQKPLYKFSYLVFWMTFIYKNCSSCPRSYSESMQNIPLNIQTDCIIAIYLNPVKRKPVFLYTWNCRSTLPYSLPCLWIKNSCKTAASSTKQKCKLWTHFTVACK